MDTIELILIAVGLSMDAFAAAICKGLSVQRLRPRHVALTAAYFGGFQGLMPLLGFLLGFRFENAIKSVDHWVAFILLAFIGANMLKESFDKSAEPDDDFSAKNMLVLAVATSIDALVVGISFAFLSVNILAASALIFFTTFCLSALGVYMGHVFGSRYKSGAEFVGGTVLILIGLKILLEHLGIVSF